MNKLTLLIAVMTISTMVQMMLTSKKEQEKLRMELGLSEDHPKNESIQGFIFHNHFRFFIVIMMILIAGYMIREAVVIYCDC